MRFFHLADLHIGKKVNQRSMLDEQRHVLKQVLQYVDTEQPQAVILAGDIYDRRNPSPEAVDLLDWFLTELVMVRRVAVLAIGGNHDSGERLDFATGILARAGLYMAGSLSLPLQQIALSDAWGPVQVTLLPYADLALLRHHLPELAPDATYQEAMNQLLATLSPDPAVRQVLVAHGVVLAPGDEPQFSDSERLLSIGGTEFWTADILKNFHYVALGHLHRPQRAGSERIRYAGSLLAYSFSEENQDKIIQVVDLDSEGEVTLYAIPLLPLHRMRTVTGALQELLAKGDEVSWKEDYLRVVLTDRGELLEPMQRLRSVFPNIMLMEREAQKSSYASAIEHLHEAVQAHRDPLELLHVFYETVTGETPDAGMHALMADVVAVSREVNE